MLTSERFIIPVYLVEKDQINSIFLRANSFILTKYKDQFRETITDVEKIAKLKCLWSDEFGANLIDDCSFEDKSFISSIKFLDKERMMMFLLKWG